MNRDRELFYIVNANHLGSVREIAVVKINRSGEFFAFTPYALSSDIDVHASKHLSGERHLRVRVGAVRQELPETVVRLQPLPGFRGTELLFGMTGLKGQFGNLNPIGTTEGQIVLLDLEVSGFRDDMFFVRIYLASPAAEEHIPEPPNVGPRILHFLHDTDPALALDVFQEAGAPLL